MFDRIAHRYDLLNHLLSCGHDFLWRSRAAKYVTRSGATRVLDIATGTADQLISVANRNRNSAIGVGVDMSAKMLTRGKLKIARKGLTKRLALIRGDALSLPIRDDEFEYASITFGIRNVANVPLALKEMKRVLTANGHVLIVEFSLPSAWWFRTVYLFYLRHILPLIGAFISGDGQAYRYLNRTVESFPYGDDFCELMRNAGFREVTAEPLTYGIATIYHGIR